MSAIFDLLSSIGEAIIGLFNFIVSFFMDLVYVVQLIGTILVQIPSFFASWLPPEIASILVLIITVASVYKIAGRD